MSVYGIDFGTCESCIAVAEAGKNPEVIPSERNQSTTPSVVWFNIRHGGRPVVGLTAKNQIERGNGASVVAFAKTQMHLDEMTSEYLVDQSGSPRRISPVEPAACIYHKLISHANSFRSGQGFDSSDKAVITVPAVCSYIQRQKTKLAAEQAGIKVLQVINEPTAAAISYNIGVNETVMVFDMGGGTLDVSIITRTSDTDYRVLASEGDPRLGGRNFDMELIRMSYETAGFPFDEAAVTDSLLVQYETYKKDLCTAGFQTIDVAGPNGQVETIDIDVAEFVQYTDPVISRAMAVIDRAIAEARRDNPDLRIDRVCLAGGASKMKAIKQAIAKHLPDVKAELNDPDQAIAKGAARYALALVEGGVNYDIRLDDRGHAYGLLTLDRNGRLVVENMILRSDPVVIEARTFNRYMPATGSSLPVTIIENDVAAKHFAYNRQPEFFKGDVSFPEPLTVGDRVVFTLSRDADGLVRLVCTTPDGAGNSRLSFETKASAVDETLLRRIAAHLTAMDAE